MRMKGIGVKQVVIEEPAIHVLAPGATAPAKNNAKGHLFEHFMARLFSYFGYKDPERRDLNVTSNGIELDLVVHHATTGHDAIAECKAYATPIRAGELNKFYGRLQGERIDASTLFGYFIAIPGLVPEADEQARRFMKHDRNFKVLTALEIYNLIQSKGLLKDPPESSGILSDLSVFITQHGLYSAAKELDPVSRRPRIIRVWGVDPVPDPTLSLLRETDYASGLEVRAVGANLPAQALAARPEPTIVEVAGSTSDFEYQPASPKHFVGRDHILSEFKHIVASSDSRVLVLNAKSGWGKSSLALQLKQLVMKNEGHALVVDSRTASTPDYVWEVLRKLSVEAEATGLLELPTSAAYSSLASTLRTFAHARWVEPGRPLLVFFDQFENVFRDARLTNEFRDLALSVPDMRVPLIVGFAWKTDLVSFTESHPYKARDDIRDRSHLVLVSPFGPREIDALLGRLERTAQMKLGGELRQRLREYSQGFPWLFKKLANHILRELQSGTSRELLLAESLNVQSLFERDLAELSPQEHEGLKVIARSAPTPVSDAVEAVSRDIIQSLVDRRLVVQIGERLDTYWDIFRDFLTSGRVPIQETYILRQTPYAVAKLLQAVVKAGGELSVPSAAASFRTSEGVIHNLSRELRLMGVLEARVGWLRLAPDIREAESQEVALRERISSALRRHRAFSILSDTISERGGSATAGHFADALPEAYPAVSAKPATWIQYARAFIHWFHYARLVSVARGVVRLESPQSTVELLSAPGRLRTPRSFPVSPPGPAAAVLAAITERVAVPLAPKAASKALHDLIVLGIVELDDYGGIFVGRPELIVEGAIAPGALSPLLREVKGGATALDLLNSNPGASASDVGRILKDANSAEWSEATVKMAGKYFRGWARQAGVSTSPPPRGKPRDNDKPVGPRQLTLK